MSCLSRFRLITFDVHNTLLQIRSAPGKKYGELGAMFGISNNKNQLVANYVQSWHKMNRLHPNFGLKTKIGYKQWWQMMIGESERDEDVTLENSKNEPVIKIDISPSDTTISGEYVTLDPSKEFLDQEQTNGEQDEWPAHPKRRQNFTCEVQ